LHNTPYPYITRAKWTGGLAQAVQHLLCKCKGLGSSPIPTKKKKGGWGEGKYFINEKKGEEITWKVKD
jgi:hypothetical protein